VLVEATLVLDGHPYWVSAWVRAAPRPSVQPTDHVTIEKLGPIEIAVPLVAGVSLASRGELLGLQPGDAWLCGDGWMLDASAEGRCVLAAPGAERGVAVDLAKTGEIVLRDEAVDLAVDVDADEAMTDADGALANAVLDAPIVVRVEVGAVSMLARDWAKLAPGDVVLAGRRIAEPAVLRVAGREVARGELVNVDGELAVRIQQIKQGE
jgi:flagellar motor switch/type III secretory pathway protein FliN